MKELIVKQATFERVEKEISIKVPSDVMYLFVYHSRLSVRVVPVFDVWNPKRYGELHSLEITVVPQWPAVEVKLHKVIFHEIGNILSNKDNNVLKTIIELISNHEERNIRTKEEFEADLNRVLEEITKQ